MRIAPHMLDRGVRDAVELLNSIDGVTTRASCEGQGEQSGHRHSDLAYVAFQFPLPARLQSFLIAELDMVARVDDDAVYCRWPHENQQFLTRLCAASRQYKRREARHRREQTHCVLSQLHARLARRAAGGQEVTTSLCLGCGTIVLSPHDCSGVAIGLFHWPVDLDIRWFAEFLEQPGNALDASLLAALGAAKLEERTRQGDFGTTFRNRWWRYRKERAQLHLTRELRAGIQLARNAGKDVDVCFDRSGAHFTWRRSDGRITR